MGKRTGGGGRRVASARTATAPSGGATVSKAVGEVLNSSKTYFVRKLSDKQVIEWLNNDKPANGFTPEKARAMVSEVRQRYPDARFHVGREYSRVVYIDTGIQFTGRQGMINDIAQNNRGLRGVSGADEMRVSSGVGFSGSATANHLNGLNQSNAVIRLWWD